MLYVAEKQVDIYQQAVDKLWTNYCKRCKSNLFKNTFKEVCLFANRPHLPEKAAAGGETCWF